MNNILSRYSPRYIRCLVYMMQASEYYPQDYLRWYHRTSNFSEVEKRKQLVKTSKAKSLLIAGYVMVGVIVVPAVIQILISPSIAHAIVLIIVVGYPFYLAYLMLAALALLNFMQKPVEDKLVADAKKVLKGHRGIKIAIAGSYGKTSMREILKTILSEGKKVAAPPGSYNTPLGIASFIQSLQGDEDFLVFELGEYYPGDVKKLCNFIEPQWGIITGVNEAHLERFGSLEATIATIFELDEWLKGKPVYINGEDPRAKERAHTRVTYSHEGAGSWIVDSAFTSLEGTHITYSVGATSVSVTSKLLGLHMVGPISAAADIATRLGLSQEQIVAGIGKTRPFPHRMQPRVESGVTIIDDSYNGNPDGVAAAIGFLKAITTRRWYVTPGLVEMGNRKADVHREIGKQLVEAGIEKVVLIRDSVTPFIEEGLKIAGFKGEIIWHKGMPEALQAIQSMTLPGDVVLIQNDWPDQYA